MQRAMKIRELKMPAGDLHAFDPGRHLSALQFDPTDAPVTEEDRVGLSGIVHYLAFLSLRGGPEPYESSLVPHSSSAYAALDAYFGHLEGWSELPRESDALPYRVLVPFLLDYYPPPMRTARGGLLGRLVGWWRGRA